MGIDLEDYDVIAVGTPTWWYTMAPAVLTFLKSCNWNGKTVIPFQMHGGWPGHVLKDMKKACKGVNFTQERKVQFDSSGGAELVTKDTEIIPAEVKHWHGAAPDSWFAHLTVEVPGEGTGTERCEAVSAEEYAELKQSK